MSEFIKRQQELKGNLTMQIRTVIDDAEAEGRGLDSAELEKIDRIESDIQAAQRSIETAAKNEERAAEVAAASRGFEVATEAPTDTAEIFRSMYRGEIREHTFGFEKRATLVPSANTVPVAFLDRIYALARLVGPYLATSEVIQRTSGEDLRIPVFTAYPTASETAAGSALSESEATYSSLLIQMSKNGFITKIANELITDVGFDLESTLVEQAANAIGTRINTLVHAAVTAVATVGGTAGTATAITADEIISLQFSADGLVRTLPGSGYMVSTSTLGAIRKLKDTNGSYILDPVGPEGVSTILGRPVYENPAVANIATGAKAVFFGHWPSVKISTTGLQAAVSSEAFFENDITAFRYIQRLGAGVANGASHIKFLLQP
jgi:HK97 family phage major capsid protein